MFIRGYAKEEDALNVTANQLLKTLKWRQNIGYDKFLLKTLPLSDRFHTLYPENILGTDKYVLNHGSFRTRVFLNFFFSRTTDTVIS